MIGSEIAALWNPESWALENVIQLKEAGIPIKIGYMRRFLQLRPEFFSFFFSYVNLVMPAKLQVVCDAILISASLTFRSLRSQFCS